MKEFIIQVLVSLLCAGLIGGEREFRNKPAGLRTHALVCLCGMCAGLLALKINAMTGYGDLARIPAAVISGMGFLGGGIIIFHHDKISGTTTAADLWCVAIIGLLIGFKLYAQSIIISILVTIIACAYLPIEKTFFNNNKYFDIRIKYDNMLSVFGLFDTLIDKDIKIKQKHIDNDVIVIAAVYVGKGKCDKIELYKALENLEGITHVMII